MELKDTINAMLSDDWKERFKAEYLQLDIRIQKLDFAIRKLTKARSSTGSSPIDLLFFRRQIRHMKRYRQEMQHRAELHGIDLND